MAGDTCNLKVAGRGGAIQVIALLGLAIQLPEAYEGGMLTEGGKTPPGKQRLVEQTHRSCGAHRWQRPADAATALTTDT